MATPDARSRWQRTQLAGWRSVLARAVTASLAFLTVTGLTIFFLPFSTFNQHSVLLHTAVGVVFLVPTLWYSVKHIRDYWSYPLTQAKFTGWAAGGMLLVCVASGVVLTIEGAFGRAITYAWRTTHIVTTFGLVFFLAPHLVQLILRERKRRADPVAAELFTQSKAFSRVMVLGTVVLLLVVGGLTFTVRNETLVNEFPADYEMDPYDGKGPFAPSLATTASGGAIDSHSLSGSESCGTSGCHEEIYKEWLPSAHRYAAMDAGFQAIQGVMADQNGPVSTRYCAGCHDPISLFSGTKFIGVEDLTGLAGYQEGISCLSCHAIEKTDVQGNANYVMSQPDRYLFESGGGKVAKFMSDFLIRTYPEQHVSTLSRRMFKTPEFCAACHKQFIDQEVNKVGWVQLQNQFDNWKESRWNHPGTPDKTLECRECHMPLTESMDPAAGDLADFNRDADDGKHRSHRFLGANQFIPKIHELEGAELHCELTEKWLRGEIEIPEIAERWNEGPAVPLIVDAPREVVSGQTVPLRVHIVNNKAGHDFPTGPLDIIQAWVEIEVTDDAGNVVYETGKMDERHFVETGTFMFKAEPVDRYGNLIDRHNLWEMVGVRFKRSLFPGQEDVASYDFVCTGAPDAAEPDRIDEEVHLDVPQRGAGTLHVKAKLNYRKFDQYLLDFAFGEDSGLTAPVTVLSEAEATIKVLPAPENTP